MSTPAADVNLLFGILALQMDFITRDQLVAGMNAWVLAKAKSLGEILLEQGALHADTRALLESLVQKHVALHGNESEKSLAALSAASSVRAQLQQIADPDVQGSLAHMASLRSPEDPFATQVGGAGESTSQGTRFRILRPHAHGGLGVVFVAQDQELRREVALKEILAEHVDSPLHRERFVLEAEVTGGLEHPGIVPVYGLGRYADGRPFYAMRFIKGASLQEAIRRFHDRTQGPRDAIERGVELRKLLRRFFDVCNAMAYAHSRGVLHRDLKPGNIMLGKYGETLVVDWGLAKPQGVSTGAASALEAPLLPASASGSAPTEMGRIVGTPSYMSPEQAAGRLDLLGPASDVYGLGTTLYCLLTGQPPFARNEDGDLLTRVQQGEFPKPQRLRQDIDPALEAICLEAMALRPEDRYPTVAALGKDVERWLLDEPVSAWPEPWSVRGRRWLRQHPGPVSAVAATVLVGVVGLLVGAILLGQKNQELSSANEKLELARKDADDKRQHAEQEQQIAQAVRLFLQHDLLQQADAWDQADRLLALGDAGFTTALNPTIRELLDRAAAELTPDKIEQKFPGQPLVQAAILKTVGSSYRGVGEYARAITHLERARSLYQTLLGADHPDTLGSMGELALSYRAAGKLNLALPLLEETRQRHKVKFGPEHPYTLLSMGNLAGGYQDAGKLELALPLYEEAFKLQKAKLGPDHPDTLGGMNNLALSYQHVGKLDLALPLFEAALRLSKAKRGPNHPNTLISMGNLASGYQAAGKLDLALPLFETTLQLSKAKLGPEHPYTLISMNNLAGGYKAAGKLELALPLFEATLRLSKAKLGSDHPDTLRNLANLAGIYLAVGKLELALPLLEETFQLSKARLGPDHPATLTRMGNLAAGYQELGKVDRALPLFEEAFQRSKAKLGPVHPDTLGSMSNLASGYLAAGKLDRALPLLEATFQLSKAKRGPDHPDTLRSMNNLAEGYQAAGKRELALPLLKDTLELSKAKLGPDHPHTLSSMNNLALGYLVTRKLELALPLFEEALQRRTAKLGPDHPATLISMINLAGGYRDVGKLDLALPLFEAALQLMKAKLGPDHPTTRKTIGTLGKAYLDAKQPDKALPHVTEFVAAERQRLGATDLRFARLLVTVGQDLLKARQFPEAEKLLRECLAIRAQEEPDAWTTYATQSQLGGALLSQKKYTAAEPLLRAGYDGMKERATQMPPQGKDQLLQAAMRRLAEFFEATRTKDESKQLGQLTDAQTEAVHELKLTAGKPVVIEMQSRQFDTYLRLQDAKGKTLAENDNIDAASKNLNSRVVFIPTADGVYRIIITSPQQSGRGDYEIILREYSAAKSK